ncbi:Quercetin 2,3-dioxygenase [compost metagenome]
MGSGSVIRPGDVQMMSAGTGVRHSEYNASREEPVHFLQIWIVPNRKGVTPRYQQQHFDAADKRGRLRLIISPDGAEGSLSVHQDARVYAGLFDGAEQQRFTLPAERFAYVHVARGALTVNGQRLSVGDGMRLRNEQSIDFSAGDDAEVLLFDLRPVELPLY